METEFHDGDIIIINPYLKPEHNDYVVVANDEGGATFKQLKKYGRKRVLHPLNPKYDDMELNNDLAVLPVGHLFLGEGGAEDILGEAFSPVLVVTSDLDLIMDIKA